MITQDEEPTGCAHEWGRAGTSTIVLTAHYGCYKCRWFKHVRYDDYQNPPVADKTFYTDAWYCGRWTEDDWNRVKRNATYVEDVGGVEADKRVRLLAEAKRTSKK